MTSYKGSNGGRSCNFFFKKKRSSSAGSFGKKMEEKEKRKKKKKKGEKLARLCFLKARDFSSSLNDRQKQMTGGEKMHSLLSGPRPCVFFLFGEPTRN